MGQNLELWSISKRSFRYIVMVNQGFPFLPDTLMLYQGVWRAFRCTQTAIDEADLTKARPQEPADISRCDFPRRKRHGLMEPLFNRPKHNTSRTAYKDCPPRKTPAPTTTPVTVSAVLAGTPIDVPCLGGSHFIHFFRLRSGAAPGYTRGRSPPICTDAPGPLCHLDKKRAVP